MRAAEKALSIDPEKPYYAFAARGLAALNQGRKAEALEDFRRFEAKAGSENITIS